jgi:hypothetical protein
MSTKAFASFVFALALASCQMPLRNAAAQIQPGPNISPNGYRFTFSPRAGYIGPPAAIFPLFAYAPLPAPPLIYGPPPGEVCTVDPLDIGQAPLLNVRASPNGWPVGLLPNGTPVVLGQQYAGDWVVIVSPIAGWVFRPLLACQPPVAPPPAVARPAPSASPADAYAQVPRTPQTAPQATPQSRPPLTPYPRTPEDGEEPYSPPVRP